MKKPRAKSKEKPAGTVASATRELSEAQAEAARSTDNPGILMDRVQLPKDETI